MWGNLWVQSLFNYKYYEEKGFKKKVYFALASHRKVNSSFLQKKISLIKTIYQVTVHTKKFIFAFYRLLPSLELEGFHRIFRFLVSSFAWMNLKLSKRWMRAFIGEAAMNVQYNIFQYLRCLIAFIVSLISSSRLFMLSKRMI